MIFSREKPSANTDFVMFQSIEVEEILNAKFKKYSYIRKNEMRDLIDPNSFAISRHQS